MSDWLVLTNGLHKCMNDLSPHWLSISWTNVNHVNTTGQEHVLVLPVRYCIRSQNIRSYLAADVSC